MYNTKAGIASTDKQEQLIIALEPEAGAIFCKERKMQDFLGQKGTARVSDALVSPGKSYVMMDIGGTKIVCCFLSLHFIVRKRIVSKKDHTFTQKIPSKHVIKGIALFFSNISPLDVYYYGPSRNY